MNKIFTVGYGGRKPSDFVELLLAVGVKTVVDVRSNQHRASMGSYILAKSPEKGIQKLLTSVAIEYVSLADELGNPDPKDLAMSTFRATIATEFEERTKRLLPIAEANPTALLCAEKHHAECHRTIIAEYLESLGWVVHNLE